MAVDPYKVLSENYAKRTEAINAQTQQAEAERQQRERAAQDSLTAANRGVYTSYKQQINPYGSFASQNNFSSGVSDYYKNASYGTMLQGIGTNQYNYNDAMNNSNSLWQNYLAQKAGNEAEALNDYNSAVLAQQKYDKEQEDAERERQEAIRQYNLNLQLQQQKLAEDKRRYDQEWAYQLQQDKLAQEAAAARSSSGGGSGGGSRRSSGGGGGGTDIEIPVATRTASPTTNTGAIAGLTGAITQRASSKSSAASRNAALAKNAKSSKETDSKSNLIRSSKTITDKRTGKKWKMITYMDGRTETKRA